MGAAVRVVKAGVDVVIAQCGSDNAKIALSDILTETNSYDNTLIRLYQK